MKTVKPERPGGFLDFGPGEFLAKEKMLKIIKKVFQSYGYNPIETPMVEFVTVLTGSDETSKNIFQISGSSSKIDENLALRFDHTVPLARYLSANPYDEKTRTGIKLPWRRSVLGPVFRSDTPQKGRYRQFYQYDVDVAGSTSMLADAEIIAIMYQTLKALGIERFKIMINNRKILNGLSDLLGITDRGETSAIDITKEVMRILDKIPKIGIEAAFDELSAEPANEFDPNPALSGNSITKLKEYLNITGSNSQMIFMAQTLFQKIPIALEGLDDLIKVYSYLNYLEIPLEYVEIDFSVARGLDYYTGPVFETYLFDAPEFGSVFSGGRYNDLVARFTGRELPAVGASIGVDRLYAALQQLGILKVERSTVSDILILRIDPNQDEFYLHLATKLRKFGLNVEISLLGDTTFKSQFNYGISLGANFLIIAGSEEIGRSSVKVKNLLTREQKDVEVSQLNEFFSNLSTSS